MSNQNQFYPSDYAVGAPLNSVFPLPIVAKRSPLTTDKAQLGRVWVWPANDQAWILTGIANNSATWTSIAGGSGVFSSLTVNPGPTNLSTVGNGAVTIGNATNTGAVTINVGSGGFSMPGNGHTIVIGADSAANALTIGSSTAGALTSIFGGNGTGVGTAAIELATAAAGDIQIGATTQTGAIYLGASTAGQTIHIGDAAAANVIDIGHATAGNITNLQSPITALPGPVYIYTGAGAPSNGLALHVGDFYINTTAATAATRLYVATAASTWTNVTCAA